MISYVVEHAIVLLRRFNQETGISDPKLDFHFQQRLEGERWAERYSLTWREYPLFNGIYGIDMSDVGTTVGSYEDGTKGFIMDRRWIWNNNPRKRGVLTGITLWSMPVFHDPAASLRRLVQLPDNPNKDKFKVGRITLG